MRKHARNNRRLTQAALTLTALASAGCLAGCGGAGGGVGASAILPTTQINGIVRSAAGSAVANAVVRFDNVPAVAATTDSDGKFALNAPTSQIAHSSLWVYDSAGVQIATENLSSATSEQILVVGQFAPGSSAPPPPPPL